MKIIMGSHLTNAASLSNDWGPPLYPRCVQAVKLRTSMSSIMRRRNGLIALSVMGLLPVLSSCLRNHNLNTGQTQPVTAQTSQPVAANYRESGLARKSHERLPPNPENAL
jgi:hypothetical protein